MQYPAHAAFVAPARQRPEIWRLGAGIALSLAVYVLGIALVYGAVAALSGLDGARRWMQEMNAATGPTGTLLLLATFVGMALGPMLAARLLHRRGAASLFGPAARLWRDFAVAVLVCAAVYGVSTLITLPGGAPRPNLDPMLWASFLPLALVAVLLQTGAEEVLFRGYLQQQLAARFATPLAWMVLPAAIFAALHYQPQIMGDNTWLMMAAVFVFALLAADLTAATGTIGAAWGLHMANNTLAILVVGTEGPLSGLALFTTPIAPDSPEIRPLFLLDIAMTVAVWAAIRVAVTRRRG